MGVGSCCRVSVGDTRVDTVSGRVEDRVMALLRVGGREAEMVHEEDFVRGGSGLSVCETDGIRVRESVGTFVRVGVARTVIDSVDEANFESDDEGR